GATVIGRGTKIDNLVHVAHNVQIGENCLLVAQVGVAGSARLGRGVILAGQAGVSDHVRLADGTMVAAQAGVLKDVDGGLVSGLPARPHGEQMRMLAAQRRVPQLLREVAALRAEVALLRDQLAFLRGERAGESLSKDEGPARGTAGEERELEAREVTEAARQGGRWRGSWRAGGGVLEQGRGAGTGNHGGRVRA